MPRILIADDDPNIRELVRALLAGGGFECCEAKDGRDALHRLAECSCDLAVIDLMMPVMDGFELCRNLRKYHENLPVLMLTAKGEISSKAAGYSAGADDYLTKPFEGEELLMRVRALLRRYRIESSQRIAIGNLVVDRASYTVSQDSKRCDIPMKEFELLFKLASSAGRTLSRDSLIEDVWGFDFDGNERTLDVHIGRLRDRFPTATSGVKITTVRGLGYRLEAES